MQIHPQDEVLERLTRVGEETDPRLVRHLAGCARCRERLDDLRMKEREPAPVVPLRPGCDPAYDDAFERSLRLAQGWDAALRRERSEAPGLLAELAAHSPEQREILLRNGHRFHRWGLAELLVERSLEEGIRNPKNGEDLARLALRVADLVKEDLYGAARLEDLRGRAWAHVGNARRLRSDLQGAERAFEKAWGRLQAGTQDLFERALVSDLQASLLRDQRRFPEAFRLLARAVSFFLQLGERHRAGRSLVNQATVHHHAGSPELGIPLLRRALELIEPAQEPRLLLIARHNLVFYLASTGRFLEARRAYREALHLYREFPDAWTQNRRRWVEAKIALGLGQPAQAEALFLAARDGFLAEEVPYDTALVSLELAVLYARQGRTAELKLLTAGMMPIFTSRQIHREALAALAFFRQAVESERAGVETVARVSEYLRKARHAPELRFPKVSG